MPVLSGTSALYVNGRAYLDWLFTVDGLGPWPLREILADNPHEDRAAILELCRGCAVGESRWGGGQGSVEVTRVR